MCGLTAIERNYGCYAEYIRSIEENDENESERAYQANLIFKKNKENLKKASEEGLPIIWFGGYEYGCDKCPYADNNTQRDFDDDIELIICRKGSPCKKYSSRKDS